MTCKKCGSDNVNVTNEMKEGTTRTKGKGCLYSIGRGMLILCTCGLWLLFGKKKSKSKTKFKSKTVAICQSCGYSWNV